MDEDTASRFVSSLVKSIQALCNGYIDFSSSIEVIGHIHLNIDRNKKLDYVLTEEVSKSMSEGSTMFASHSYHSHPPPSKSNDSSKKQKNTDSDPIGISIQDVSNSRTNSQDKNSNNVQDSGDSSHSGSQDNAISIKQERLKSESRSSCQVKDSLDRRRKLAPSSYSSPSPAKRNRTSDIHDVIEIKEEPEEEPGVFFSNAGSGAG